MDKVQERGIDGLEASNSNVGMPVIREELSVVIPMPRPIHSNHGALGLGVQMRSHRAAREVKGTREGEEAPDRKKNR